MISYRYLRLFPVILCLTLHSYAGLVGISYDPTLSQNQIRSVDPLTGATTLLNSFSFSSNSWNPETFSANAQLGRLYAQSGDQTVYTFGAYSGQILNSVVADTGMGAMNIGLSGNLIGISYNPVSMENEVRSLNPLTGNTVLLNTVNFSGGGYSGGTLAVAPTLNRFYIQSGDDTVYTFDLTTGQILNTKVADTSMQVLTYLGPGDLIGIDYNPQTMQNEVRIVNPATGATTLLNSLVFSSGGWYGDTFTIDAASNVFYAESGDGVLYTFDLTTGAILATKQLDTTMYVLGEVPNAPVPEPSLLGVVAIILPVLWRRKGLGRGSN